MTAALATAARLAVAGYWCLIGAAALYALGCVAWRALTALGWSGGQVYSTFIAVWGVGVPAVLSTALGPDPTAALVPGVLFGAPMALTLGMLVRWWVNPASMRAVRVREGARP